MVSADIHFVDAEDGTALAYCATPAQAPEGNSPLARGLSQAPGVVFLGGFMSDMTGQKATVLEAWTRATGRAFLRLDYAGHGASGGAFRDGTIGRWRDDALTVIRHAGQTVPGLGGDLVLVGSSMGGWIATLVAKALTDEAGVQNIAGLVTIAAAADFTEDLLPARLGTEALAQIAETGIFEAPSKYADAPYVITGALLEEGRNHLVLIKPLALNIPVRLIHGTADPDVPWAQSQKLMDVLTSGDVELILIKNGDHRLSEPRDLARMIGVVGRLCDQVSASSAASPAR
ncbi:MAG: alpha/beta fold hydrolase [Proteobacteria bacterium]|nr:alpha/beta fold hydrolase [Pseudomonadota bacterium]